MSSPNSSGLGFALLSIGSLLAGIPVLAQGEDSGGSGLQLEEITVTARKVAERLQDVPVAVTAFTAETIGAQGFTSLDDVARFTPGLNFENQFGRQDTSFNTSIRGVSSISNGALSFKPFANFIDGVYVRGSLESFDLSDVERIEVLRGPQAALYGRATESGAINYITRQPTNDFHGALDVSGASFDEKRAFGRLSGPLIADQLYFTANASYYSRGGEYLNLFSGSHDDTQKTRAASFSLRYAASRDFDATLRVGYSRDDDGPPAIGYSNGNQNNCYLAVYPYFCGIIQPSGTVNLDNATPVYNGFASTTSRASLAMNYRFGGFTLTSLTGWDTNHQKIGEDQSYDDYKFPAFTGLPANGFISSTNYDSHSLSEELRLTSPRDRPLRYLVGAYWYYETTDTADVQAPFDFFTYGALNQQESSVHNAAGFGQIEYDFTSAFSVSVEARWQQDVIRYSDPQGLYFEKVAYDAFNPRLVLNYRVQPDVLLYASVGRGTKPGGFNGPPIVAPETASFSEEKLWAYEIGAKTEWLNRRVLVNADLYYNKISNLQVTSALALPSGAVNSYNTNAASAHTQGLEIEAAGRLTDMLTLRLTYSYNEARYDDFQGFQDLCNLAGQYSPDFVTFSQGPITNGACLAGPQGNARGKTLPNAPQTIASVSIDYTQPVTADVRWFLRPAYSYKSSSYDEAENLAQTGAQGILNLRVGVEGERWRLTLFGRNLTDQDHVNYILRYIDFGAFNTTFLGPNRSFAYALPDRRQFGVQAGLRF